MQNQSNLIINKNQKTWLCETFLVRYINQNIAFTLQEVLIQNLITYLINFINIILIPIFAQFYLLCLKKNTHIFQLFSTIKYLFSEVENME